MVNSSKTTRTTGVRTVTFGSGAAGSSSGESSLLTGEVNRKSAAKTNGAGRSTVRNDRAGANLA